MSQDHEARRVAVIVFDAELENAGLVQLRRAPRRYGGGEVAELDGAAHRLRSRQRGLGAGVGEAPIEISLTLTERLRV